MLKTYSYAGFTWQFEEGNAPEGAVEVKDEPKASELEAEAETKTKVAKNKAKTAKSKE